MERETVKTQFFQTAEANKVLAKVERQKQENTTQKIIERQIKVSTTTNCFFTLQ